MLQHTPMEPVDVKALDERGRYVTYARLRAHQAHWPKRFEARYGREGAAMLAALEPQIRDHNRYLKQRRIALAQLAAGGLD